MSQIQCSCGSKNCSLIPWDNTKEGAKSGGLGGAVVGALIGLAGGPIGAIAGAAIGAAGGAAFGKEQPTDNKGRKIEKYRCNSCNKKFEICPQCHQILSYETKSSKNHNGTTTKKYCKICNNLISSDFTKNQTPAERAARNNAAATYIESVKRNINSFDD